MDALIAEVIYIRLVIRCFWRERGTLILNLWQLTKQIFFIFAVQIANDSGRNLVTFKNTSRINMQILIYHVGWQLVYTAPLGDVKFECIETFSCCKFGPRSFLR